ncbi:MAG TPA: hypothetical protein VFZ44_01655, partial [Pyrinomonadaceae bacterium]
MAGAAGAGLLEAREPVGLVAVGLEDDDRPAAPVVEQLAERGEQRAELLAPAVPTLLGQLLERVERLPEPLLIAREAAREVHVVRDDGHLVRGRELRDELLGRLHALVEEGAQALAAVDDEDDGARQARRVVAERERVYLLRAVVLEDDEIIFSETLDE